MARRKVKKTKKIIRRSKPSLWKYLVILLGICLLLVILILKTGGYVIPGKTLKPLSNPSQPQTNMTSFNDVDYETRGGLITYTNKGLGFKFQYPSKYGKIIAEESYGTEGRFGRAIFFNFSNMCEGCQGHNPWTVTQDSPGLVEMATISKNFSGIGTDRSLPTTGGYKVDELTNTITFNRWIKTLKYPYVPFNGVNILGVIEQAHEGDMPETRIVFNLNSDREFIAFDFLVHDKNGESQNAENVKSIAKTFEIIK